MLFFSEAVMFPTRAAAVSLCFLQPFSARADWEMTRWHMTMNQVAVSGLPVIVPTSDQEKKAYSDERHGAAEFSFQYKIDGSDAIGYLLFNKKGLSQIKLKIKNAADLPAVRRYLVRRYGDPIRRGNMVEGCETIGYAFGGEKSSDRIIYYSRTCQGEARFVGEINYDSLDP